MTVRWFQGEALTNERHPDALLPDELPPLGLRHGSSDNGLCWISVAPARQQEYDVVLSDARGHGLSEAPGQRYGAEAMADDAKGVCDTLSFANPTLMGHSMGAIAAMVAAGKYADRLRAVILETPCSARRKRKRLWASARQGRRGATHSALRVSCMAAVQGLSGRVASAE